MATHAGLSRGGFGGPNVGPVFAPMPASASSAAADDAADAAADAEFGDTGASADGDFGDDGDVVSLVQLRRAPEGGGGGGGVSSGAAVPQTASELRMLSAQAAVFAVGGSAEGAIGSSFGDVGRGRAIGGVGKVQGARLTVRLSQP
jgi:hypothetical protein